MISPACLSKGDKIAIVSTARSITFEEVHPAIRFFQRHELEVVLGVLVSADVPEAEEEEVDEGVLVEDGVHDAGMRESRLT